MNILAKNLLILASAGSGKTYQLSNRIIGLIAKGVDPEKIVALTFTRKAAGEFADAVLNKLADAASDPKAAKSLLADIQLSEADFHQALTQVARSLHRITLGTMDSFFAKVVRGFQYELGVTGGRFDLLEGPQAEAITDDILNNILSDVLSSSHGDEFSHAFRRATIGKEEQTIHRTLRDFIRQWHLLYRESPDCEWGPEALATKEPQDWEQQKHRLKAAALEGLPNITYTDKRQQKGLEKIIHTIAEHTIGSGRIGKETGKLMQSLLTASAVTDSDSLELQLYKPFTVHDPTADALRQMIHLAAECEFAAALQRTRAVRDVVQSFDQRCATQLREKGRLGFSDVKLLMGQWAHSEDARLRREAVDFRLDARIDHWLLDEFQDTSRSDWNGLLPLLDEAAATGDGSLFVVGDRKQAIYAWRGGDVSLFDEVLTRYRGGIDEEPLDESWRSCPEVLNLVNQVCGNKSHLRELFGDAAERWEWHDHTPAAHLTDPSKRGHASVEHVGDWSDRLDRTAEILESLDVGKRNMTCGVLLRGNQKAKEVADDLKSRGFDVILEGHREPTNDAPIGIAITQLLKWLANPAEPFAWNTIKMSPLHHGITELHGGDASDIWKQITTNIAADGFHQTIKTILTKSCPNLSEFGESRVNDLLAALTAFDQQNTCSLRQVADQIDRLQISQSPGTAAVQVMTIHKSKGLGFDVVILPEIPTSKIPEAQYFNVARGETWMTQTPAQWARELIPELREKETVWSEHQRYESFCTLYVAMTRAKRGLYLLIGDSAIADEDPTHPSLSNWVVGSLESQPEANETGLLHDEGSANWASNYEAIQEIASDRPNVELSPVTHIANPKRITPSRHTSSENSSPTGRKFGTEVHSLLEKVSWVDEVTPVILSTPAGEMVGSILKNSEFESVFTRSGRNIQLLREQSVDSIHNGSQISGIIDRLHLHLNEAGAVNHVDIIDFKTDAQESPSQLAEKYALQLQRYQESLSQIYPQATICGQLLLTHHGRLVTLP